MTYYAKSNRADHIQETVRAHLEAVKILAGEYGSAFGAKIPAELCGLFHDFGKYSPAFQNVLRGTQTGVDHAAGGAAFLHVLRKKAFRPVIEAVAAHHSQLVSVEDLAGMLKAPYRRWALSPHSAESRRLCAERTPTQRPAGPFSGISPTFASPPPKLLRPGILWPVRMPPCYTPGCCFPAWWMRTIPPPPVFRHKRAPPWTQLPR